MALPRRRRTHSLECWTLLPALARETSRLRFGALVTCNNYRHPPLLAKMAATLDHLSAGRLEFGLGAGWYEHEYVAYGYDFPSAGTRLAQLDEALRICRLMWTEERATFHGRHYRVRKGMVQPEAGAAAASADHDRRRRREGAAAHRRAARRSLELRRHRWRSSRTRSGCSNGTARRWDAIVRAIEKTWFGNVIIEPDAARLEARLAKRAARGHGDAYGLNAMIGTPEQIAARIREYVAVGVTHFIAMFGRVERLGATELFAREVIPAFR